MREIRPEIALLRANQIAGNTIISNEYNKDTNDLLMERGEKRFEKRPNAIIYPEVVEKLRVPCTREEGLSCEVSGKA